MAACTLLAGVKAIPVHAGAGLACGLAGGDLSLVRCWPCAKATLTATPIAAADIASTSRPATPALISSPDNCDRSGGDSRDV